VAIVCKILFDSGQIREILARKSLRIYNKKTTLLAKMWIKLGIIWPECGQNCVFLARMVKILIRIILIILLAFLGI
jgi:hypothetical protein